MLDGQKNLVVSIDEDLHQKLKVYCAEEKTSIKEMVSRLIVEELKRVGERRL